MKYLKKISMFIFTFFACTLLVKAETGVITSDNGVQLRNMPSTAGSRITGIPYNASVNIVNKNAGSGNGCTQNWFQVTYNSYTGYVCSTYIRIGLNTSYGRPWTTPKKAIVGGSEFLSSSYISKGQYTSYLKKFNVNPNGYYDVFNHQYMANLAAPSSEAKTTYNSLVKNNLLNSSFNFVIPVYNSMPASTYNANILNTGIKSASTLADAKFESSISGFPDNYKPYLRYLHSIHSNWTFTPLNTGINWSTAVAEEKEISSIQISTGLCEKNPYVVTENGWCIGNKAVTEFYLDPRNFLSETYISMFENLSYSNIYSEAVIQSTVNNTFMSGKSTLDNQTYASIFMEAGKKNNVSPLYLASLAIQESGRNGSKATSGEAFTYQGYSYSGLYNFFNIGAKSSAESPILEGLVYANGGKGANQGGGSSGGNIGKIPNYLGILNVTTINGYIKGYGIGTKIKTIKNIVGSKGTVTVKNTSGKVVSDSSLIATGYTVTISTTGGSKTYTYVLKGDVNGDGEVNSADLLKIRQKLLGMVNLSGPQSSAAELTGEGEINSADLLKVRQYLLGMTKISQ